MSQTIVYNVEPFLYGPPQTRRAASEESFLHFDALESVTQRTGSGGGVLEQSRYEGFGTPILLSGATIDLGWVGGMGYYGDGITSATRYIRQRWYRAEFARWMSRDPLGVIESRKAPYVYVNNSPIENSDPSGLEEAIPNYTQEDIDFCYQRLTLIARGFGEAVGLPGLPCSGQLLRQAIKRTGVIDPCPKACSDALGDIFPFNPPPPYIQILAKNMASCGGLLSDKGQIVQPYRYGEQYDHEDVHYSFGSFNAKIEYSMTVECTKNCVGRCCKCTAYGDYNIEVLDKYDFCGTHSNQKRSLTWCGCR